MTFPESKVAHYWIDQIEAMDGKGIEFGAAAHNPFGFRNCIFADREPHAEDSDYYKEQMRLAGWVLGTHVKADLGKPLPFDSEAFDYIVTSHVLEHVWDLLACFQEMRRILRPFGLMVHVLPHVERTRDKGRPLTPWEELAERHANPDRNPNTDVHHSVFDTETFLDVLRHIPYLKVLDVLDVDDKVGNGFLVVLQLKHTLAEMEGFKAQRPFRGEFIRQPPRAPRTWAREVTQAEYAWLGRSGAGRPGRNEPCPCGSGDKFKHCHGKQD